METSEKQSSDGDTADGGGIGNGIVSDVDGSDHVSSQVKDGLTAGGNGDMEEDVFGLGDDDDDDDADGGVNSVVNGGRGVDDKEDREGGGNGATVDGDADGEVKKCDDGVVGDEWELGAKELQQLREELEEMHPDGDIVRELCTNKSLPRDLRPKVWALLLGVFGKLSPFTPSPPWDGPLDLPQQDALHADCGVVIAKLASDTPTASGKRLPSLATARRASSPSPASPLPPPSPSPLPPSSPATPSSPSGLTSLPKTVAGRDATGNACGSPTSPIAANRPTFPAASSSSAPSFSASASASASPSSSLSCEAVERLVTFYCKSRSVAYTPQLLHVLAPLLSLGLGPAQTFACFYSLCREHHPRLFHSSSTLPPDMAAAATVREHHLLRLLVAHSDPALAKHLDSIRPNWHLPKSSRGCIPSMWLTHCMAGHVRPSLLLRVWDQALLSGAAFPLGIALAAASVLAKAPALMANNRPYNPKRGGFDLVAATLDAPLVAVDEGRNLLAGVAKAKALVELGPRWFLSASQEVAWVLRVGDAGGVIAVPSVLSPQARTKPDTSPSASPSRRLGLLSLSPLRSKTQQPKPSSSTESNGAVALAVTGAPPPASVVAATAAAPGSLVGASPSSTLTGARAGVDSAAPSDGSGDASSTMSRWKARFQAVRQARSRAKKLARSDQGQESSPDRLTQAIQPPSTSAYGPASVTPSAAHGSPPAPGVTSPVTVSPSPSRSPTINRSPGRAGSSSQSRKPKYPGPRIQPRRRQPSAPSVVSTEGSGLVACRTVVATWTNSELRIPADGEDPAAACHLPAPAETSALSPPPRSSSAQTPVKGGAVSRAVDGSGVGDGENGVGGGDGVGGSVGDTDDARAGAGSGGGGGGGGGGTSLPTPGSRTDRGTPSSSVTASPTSSVRTSNGGVVGDPNDLEFAHPAASAATDGQRDDGGGGGSTSGSGKSRWLSKIRAKVDKVKDDVAGKSGVLKTRLSDLKDNWVAKRRQAAEAEAAKKAQEEAEAARRQARRVRELQSHARGEPLPAAADVKAEPRSYAAVRAATSTPAVSSPGSHSVNSGRGAGDEPPATAFGIGSDDDDSDDEGVPVSAAAAASPDSHLSPPPTKKSAKSARRTAAVHALELAGLAKGNEWDFAKWDNISQVFRCRKEKVLLGFAAPQLIPRYLAIAGDRFLVLAAHRSKMGVGIVHSNHHVTELSKLSFKKSAPQRIELTYKHSAVQPGAPAVNLVRVYHMEDPTGFKTALTTTLRRFR